MIFVSTFCRKWKLVRDDRIKFLKILLSIKVLKRPENQTKKLSQIRVHKWIKCLTDLFFSIYDIFWKK